MGRNPLNIFENEEYFEVFLAVFSGLNTTKKYHEFKEAKHILKHYPKTLISSI